LAIAIDGRLNKLKQAGRPAACEQKFSDRPGWPGQAMIGLAYINGENWTSTSDVWGIAKTAYTR